MTHKITRVLDPTPCYALRHTVFVGEQNVPPALERDALDDTAIHLLAKVSDTPMGAARIVVMGDTGKIGRVCVMPAARGTGLGRQLIKAAVDVLRSRHGVLQARLGAQVQAMGFYEKLGFAPVGEVYDDAGIPHRDMVRDL